MLEIKDKVVVITGGSKGLGRVLGKTFAEAGAIVCLAARNEEGLKKCAEEIVSAGGRSFYKKCDVSKYADCEALAEAAKAEGEIAVLINNAGIYVQKLAWEFTPEEWAEVIRINLIGAYHAARVFIPQMIENKRGSIVNISSIHGKIGDVKLSAHCASKFGLIGLTESLAKELKQYNIAVNALCPGAIDWNAGSDEGLTGDKPSGIKDLTSRKAIADLALFLARQEAAGVTGASVDIFGATDKKIVVETA